MGASGFDLSRVEEPLRFGNLRVEPSLTLRYRFFRLVDAEPGLRIAAVQKQDSRPDVNRLMVEPAGEEILALLQQLEGPRRRVGVLRTNVDLV